MQSVNTVLQNIAPEGITHQQPRKTFDQHTVDATQYFFARLRMIYGAGKFDATWPTDADLKMAKREWAESIAKHTKEELDSALSHAKENLHSDDYAWPNVGLILSGNKRHLSAAHRLFLPEPERNILPPEQAKLRVAALLGML